MASSSCKKCGSKKRRIYPTFNAAAVQQQEEPTALVYISQSAYLDSSNGLRRLYIGEELNLQFSLIKSLLDQSCDVLYFKKEEERVTFLFAYPELEGCAR